MCQGAVVLIAKALHAVDNAESILNIKNLIALFMQTMNVGDFIFHSADLKSLNLHFTDMELPSPGFRRLLIKTL